LIVGIVLMVLACVALLLGVLGTVGGMIQSFRVIAESDTAPQPSQLARGISAAMFATLIGLAGGGVLGAGGLILVVVAVVGLARTRQQRREPPPINDEE